VVLLVVAVVVAGVCVRLGFWQLDRLGERRQRNAAVEAGLAEPPADLDDLLAGTADPDALAYRRVTSTGSYDLRGELLLYGRALEGRPGDHVLTPLVTSGGAAVLVDRGWIPYEPGRRAPLGPPAAAPEASVSVEGVLLPSEEGAAFADDPTLVRAVNVPEIDARTDGPALAPVYLLLQDQAPAQGSGLPVAAAVPAPSEGPHLSYAIQWFTFATIAIVGYVVLARRDRREDRPRDEPSRRETQEA
jgi:surfeit locus 1 family protein